MRVSKTTAVTVWTIIFAVYLLFLAWTFYEYNNYVTDLIAWYEEKMPGSSQFVDPLPYRALWYGRAALGFTVVVAATAITFFLLLEPKPKPKTSTSTLILILLVSLLLFQVPSFALNTQLVRASPEPILVNALIYFDEECTDASQREQMYRQFFEYSAGDTWRPATRFKDVFDITFASLQLSWHNFWESDDAKTDSYTLLQDAIEQLGGVYDSANHYWVWQQKDYQIGRGYFIADFLIVVSNQNLDLWGYSPPMWNAMIIRFDMASSEHQNVLIHELSHQFNCFHCENFCVMNPQYIDLTWNWCQSCSTTIYINREKWGYKEFICMYADPPSGGTTNPAARYIYQKIRGSTMTITAYPDPNSNITPIADAYVNNLNPDGNYGDWERLVVLSSVNIIYYTYLKISFYSMSSDLVILSAKIWLKTTGYYPWSQYPILATFVSDDSWAESTITWNNKPVMGTTLASTLVTSPNTWYSWDITAQAKSEYHGDKLLSLGFRADIQWEDDYVDADFCSKEYHIDQPYLELITTPRLKYAFQKWVTKPDNCQYTENPRTFNVTTTLDVYATFTLLGPPPSPSGGGTGGGGRKTRK